MERCGDYQGVVGGGISNYAVERCGGLQGVIGDGIYMQCRGEWKLARVTSGVSAMHVFRATSQSPLQLRVAVVYINGIGAS